MLSITRGKCEISNRMHLSYVRWLEFVIFSIHLSPEIEETVLFKGMRKRLTALLFALPREGMVHEEVDATSGN